MSSSNFNNLLVRIGPSIARRDTKWRKAIPAKIRLAVTLRFLATGDSYQSLHYLFKISPQVISEIVPEVCSAIIEALKDIIKIPKEKQEWLAIASNFETGWQFPHCLGVMDGKHIVLQCPFNTNSEYYNYKGSFSIVLMALVDSNYNFIYADIGCQGRISDGGVFRNSTLYENIYRPNATIPQSVPIAGYKNEDLPSVFLADDAFELTTKILMAFIRKGLFNGFSIIASPVRAL
ncbi:uncharacterized protein LOC126742384 [Anthonomus grandis grandis]|uniref:uncharacterized protein LOC126742384 n=1 Tax=Anthonomus grandis grandis TaxID=2921223 RepID=UPI0021658107|nr:uncharacterized protein LOC126742384 [Anthonomus grandis grandis]